jgi:hypothetical protein
LLASRPASSVPVKRIQRLQLLGRQDHQSRQGRASCL